MKLKPEQLAENIGGRYGRPAQTRLERFWSYVDKEGPTQSHMDTPCWLWTASTSPMGYGSFWMGKETHSRAHRVSWFIRHQVDTELNILHHCDNPSCVNPDHLFAGTQQDNVDDMFAKGRGHKASGEEHGITTLTIPQVIVIRAYAQIISQSELAIMFGVARTTVNRIINRQSWAYI